MESRVPLRKTFLTGIATLLPDRRFLVWSSVVLAALAGAELALRSLGLHTPLLYETTSYGYRVRPDQELHRLGNRVFINSQGLRSESIAPLPADGAIRVLCIGDSITNGGAITDQADTYPYQLERLLRASGRRVEVLNASAPGWAIANEAGWLRAHGTIGSQVVLFTIGSTDLFQSMASAEIVDRHPSFPSQAPPLALTELWLRYLMPHLLRQTFADPGVGEPVGSTPAPNQAVAQVLSIAEYVRKQGVIALVLYVDRPGQLESSDPLAGSAKLLLFEALKQHRIPHLNTRDAVEQAGGASLFRDGLHPNAEGNRVIAQAAFRLLSPIVEEIPPVTK